MSEPHPISSHSACALGAPVATDFRCIGTKRMWAGIASVAALCLVFVPVFLEWYRLAMSDDLHSHLILIPLVSLYLLVTSRSQLAWHSKPSPAGGFGVMALSAAVFGWALVVNPTWSVVDLTALKIFTFIGLLWGLGLVVLGWQWMRSAAFPMAFLLFMIPIPDLALVSLERFLMAMSASLSELLFSAGGIPVFRSGQVIELPGMVLEVAQECSGIRSSWVLLITSVLAAHLFLPTVPRKIALVAAVLPLAILRNSVRIFVIGWLCVHYGPDMIDGWIHRKGGPVFFAASLVPLFLMAWWLRKRKIKEHSQESTIPETPPGGEER